MRRSATTVLVIALVLALQTLPILAQTINGFPVGNAVVPVSHLKRAAPARDSIPALTNPRFVSPNEIKNLNGANQVFSLTIGGETRAYPLPVMVWHEVVNDTFGDEAVVVTYSALTGTVLAFRERDPQAVSDFGVSGVLYNSGLLFYDHETMSMWSQLKGSAVSGPRVGETLVGVGGTRQTWSSWKAEHPNGKVLWPDNDRSADYEGDWPYGNYAGEPATIFPFDINRNDLKTKDRLVGLTIDGKSRAWPAVYLASRTTFYDSVGTHQVKITHDESAHKTEVRDLMTGELLPAVFVYWFAWQAFNPDTSVWEPLN